MCGVCAYIIYTSRESMLPDCVSCCIVCTEKYGEAWDPESLRKLDFNADVAPPAAK